MKNSSIIIFDLETNGLKGSSVLSVSAAEVKYLPERDSLEVVDRYNRYYFRNKGEELNQKAIQINGLTDKVIKKRREGCDYPETFLEDLEAFKQFCEGAVLYIAHNIDFDKDFVPFIKKSSNTFCTMQENTFINRSGRWPTLKSTAEYYDIPVTNGKLHDGQYDVSLCFEIVKAMCDDNHRGLMKVFRKGGLISNR